MATEQIQTLVVGGGQAGLAMSHMLKERGCEHLVLERHRIAERWRSERWDGLRFQFPNWSVTLPNFPFQSAEPHAYASAREIADFIGAYARFVMPPIRCGVNVQRLRCRDASAGFVAKTSQGEIAARNVVVATGPYQRPSQPSFLPEKVDLLQIHASSYRNPAQLPSGAVLIIGGGASGAQIAEELVHAGRTVYLSIGKHRRLPRRYRGRDLIWWMSALGLDRVPAENRGEHNSLPLISGAFGGNTIDFRQFAAMGVILLGRLVSVSGRVFEFAPDLAKNIADGDMSLMMFLDMVDAHINCHNMLAPDEPSAREMLPDPPNLATATKRLDLRTEGISTIISATGYAYDFGWIDAPLVLDQRSRPIHRMGITDLPGFYFVGLQWLSTVRSSLLSGVGEDAQRLADHIKARG
ncbi:MAG: NAD(P)-binding domain-containing protein [Bradyrhizobium sp.]|uniref:NAD(P)-binding domain-containing protein n=1 Tax=Bradyrhizobium sp. TaxID=376 RepID=UPI0025BBEEF4|nr:NAD(P)-binding domain-containing protein [Bradyrhizobium sp.]MBI5261800.1 NAD(P)-binding domain-containing protein [Bradyrhizobium sp.]